MFIYSPFVGLLSVCVNLFCVIFLFFALKDIILFLEFVKCWIPPSPLHHHPYNHHVCQMV